MRTAFADSCTDPVDFRSPACAGWLASPIAIRTTRNPLLSLLRSAFILPAAPPVFWIVFCDRNARVRL